MKGAVALVQHKVVLKASVGPKGLCADSCPARLKVTGLQSGNQALKSLQELRLAEGALVLAESVAPMLGKSLQVPR